MEPHLTGARTFTVREPIWRRVDAWADRHGYRLTDWHSQRRIYKRPHHLRRRQGRWVVSVDDVRRRIHVAGSLETMRFAPLSSSPTTARAARADLDRLLASLSETAAE